MMQAAGNGDVELLRRMLDDSDASIEDIYDEHGTGLLHWAALYGHLEIIELLIERGADVDMKDKVGIYSSFELCI